MRVTKREVIIGATGFILALLLAGGVLWWHGHNKPRQLSLAAGTTSNPNVSLDQGSEDSSGLNVSGQASNLGQLNGDQSQSGQSGQSGAGGNSSSGSSVDTSTFAAYNKYRNNKDALFGDMKKGGGGALTAGKQAGIYYKVWLTNGALIDQSPVSASGQPQPFSFKLGAHQVITGLEEGVYGMKVGGSRLVIVPPAVGYGSQAHASVPADSVLVFEVQLVSVR